MNRRDVLGASAAAMTAALVGAPSANAANPRFNVANNANLLQTYARVRGGPGDGLALWWYTGTVWGKSVDDIARPMFGVQGLTFNRISFKRDGGIEQRLTGRGWYADPVTGQPLQAWIHPITGEKIAPPHIKSLQTQYIAADGTLAPREPDTVDAFSGGVGGLTVNGDTVWLTENFVAKYKPDAARGGAINTTSSLSTFTAKIKDVESEKGDFVPAYLNYQSLGAWPAWMKMTDKTGVLSWQTRGQKMRSINDGPPELRNWVDAFQPGFLRDPGI